MTHANSFRARRDAARRERNASAEPGMCVAFKEFAGRVEARLGKVIVGEITTNPTPAARFPFFWTCKLPQVDRRPRPARDVEAARKGVENAVKQWIEAAGLAVSRSALMNLESR